ncbi:hypothetical protein EDD17DRAFT_1531751 [Pisolithus thermaeus]|nr:hypothetical protein EDD17DRAFT_1531751 [Pisolithus thermaeus]
MADYGRYNSTNLRESLTVEKGRRQGAAFVHKMLQAAKSRSHIIFTDTLLNDAYTVYRNIYQSLLITAAKMDYYIENWGIDIAKNERCSHALNPLNRCHPSSHPILTREYPAEGP